MTQKIAVWVDAIPEKSKHLFSTRRSYPVQKTKNTNVITADNQQRCIINLESDQFYLDGGKWNVEVVA